MASVGGARAAGRTPAVFLFPIGHPAMRTARATVAANFFGCAGFDIQDHLAFETVQAGVEAGWQGDTGDGGYEATQVGPVLRWVTPGWTGALAGGWKGIPGDDTWYAGVEVSFPLMGR